MNARLIIGEQHIGDATDAERDEYCWTLAKAMEEAFPGLSVDYNPLSGRQYEWQDDSGVDRAEVERWVEANWERLLP